MSDSKKENLFKNLARRNEPAVSDTKADAVETPQAEETLEEPVDPSPAPLEPGPSSPARRSRSTPKKEEPKGKRGHPDYVQANAYVPKKLRKAVDRVLLDLDGVDYSTLVTDLLRKWLKSRGVSE